MTRHPGLDDPRRRPTVPPRWHTDACRCDMCQQWNTYREQAMADADTPTLFGGDA